MLTWAFQPAGRSVKGMPASSCHPSCFEHICQVIRHGRWGDILLPWHARPRLYNAACQLKVYCFAGTTSCWVMRLEGRSAWDPQELQA